jgi:hypothetical protein
MRIFIFLFFSVAITGCCKNDSVELARYGLSDAEMSLIPYKTGEKITFGHSEGYEFQFEVTENIVEWEKETEFCEWFCCAPDYYSFQMRTTVIESSYPDFSITYEMTGHDWDHGPGWLDFKINHRHFLTLQYDSSAQFIMEDSTAIWRDTATINNHLFRGVIEKKFENHMYTNDSSKILPESIMYNKKYGLLQIKMTNNEKFSIKN